jgi:hypothetical protein
MSWARSLGLSFGRSFDVDFNIMFEVAMVLLESLVFEDVGE